MPGCRLRCIECGAQYDEAAERLVCDRCTVRQAPGGAVRGQLEVVLDGLPGDWPDARSSSPAFLEAFLPVTGALLAPLAVGDTPLLPVPRLRRRLGMAQLWLKDDSRNPSGSTKDRASLLVAAKARQFGKDTIAAASTGNAATALAAVTAASGQRAVLFVPSSAPEGKLVQMASYGATVLRIAGTYDQAFELCLEACDRFGWYNRNTALNPFTVEGKKTAALEIAADAVFRDGGPPDVVVVTVGDGVILSGVAKGFADLVRAGLTTRVPRLLAVQPTGSSAIVDALDRGAEVVTPQPGASSVADSLVVEEPRGAYACLRAIRASNGAGVAVSDEAILDALAVMAREAGVFAEPAAAAALAGLVEARERGLVEQDERVVLLVTGNGLKDIASARRTLAPSEVVAPTLDAVAARLAQTP